MLYDEIFKLKNLMRRGWILRDASKTRIESDAEHCFSCCILALDIIKKEQLDLNVEKVLKILLYHEFGEIDAGDVTPVDNVSRCDKYDKEKLGIERISNECNMPELIDLWLEFENQKSKESVFCKKIDKLDTLKQAKIYSTQSNKPELYEEFYSNAKDFLGDLVKYAD